MGRLINQMVNGIVPLLVELEVTWLQAAALVKFDIRELIVIKQWICCPSAVNGTQGIYIKRLILWGIFLTKKNFLLYPLIELANVNCDKPL